MSEADATERPFVAGMYDYYLGGTANTAADRALVHRVQAVLPEITAAAWGNRGFLQRAVTRMAAEWDIHQFLDIGAGLPTQRNTHEVVADVVPDAKVVYVDNDPRVIARGSKLLAEEHGAAIIEADIRDIRGILDHPETRRLIDFGRPVGLLMVAVTQFVRDEEDPWGLVARYLDAVPSGSYLALSAPTNDHQAERIINEIGSAYAETPTPARMRSAAAIGRFFDGLEIVPPYEGAEADVSFVGLWGAEDPVAADDDGSRWIYAAVARKP